MDLLSIVGKVMHRHHIESFDHVLHIFIFRSIHIHGSVLVALRMMAEIIVRVRFELDWRIYW